MTPRPMTDAECELLMHQPPHHKLDLAVGNLRVWVCRYDRFPDPFVTVWAGADYIHKSMHVWFPRATPASLKAWAETLPQPKPVPPKRVKIQEETELAA